MLRALLIICFIASVAGNSLAGVNPHFDGDSDCSGSCCRAARMKATESVAASLCCLVDCNQPAENNSSLTKGVASTRSKDPSALAIFRLPATLSRVYVRFPNSPTTRLGSSNRYLETCSLLI
jgi:hypothetical protein